MRTPTWHQKLPDWNGFASKPPSSRRAVLHFAFARRARAKVYVCVFRWLVAALILALVLACLERAALEYFVYWRYPWSDTLMHFLGGATIGALAVGLIHQFKPRMYLAFLVAAALGWEFFEYAVGATRYGRSFLLDTSSDLLFDALGATLVYAIARFSLWRSA